MFAAKERSLIFCTMAPSQSLSDFAILWPRSGPGPAFFPPLARQGISASRQRSPRSMFISASASNLPCLSDW